ncbi:MAG: hypothetical protein P9M07_04970 [Candidatus Aceula meridiana]|nr:hypothetical protein [Candidatus Aceula meridiana]
MRKFILIGFICLVFNGCGVINTITIPAGTSAGTILKSDIARFVDIQQKAYMPNCPYKIIETKIVGKKDEVIFEEWIVEACGKKAVYDVRIKTVSLGGSTFSVRRKE